MVDPRVPSLAEVTATQIRLVRWLCEHALPLWDSAGVDRASGGYFENLHVLPGGALEASGEVRRGRVIARQIYVFETGRRLGWRTSLSDPVQHGCDYLFQHVHVGDGWFNTALAATRVPVLAANQFSLYEYAFYLFALAQVYESQADRYPVADTAARCLRRLRSGWGRAGRGFEESMPPTLPLKSNPHMHLLEAALAWLDVTNGARRQPWIELATELVELCLTRFMDSESGAVREYFDGDWRPAPGIGRIIEPGHQFEWAWLLMRWSSSEHCRTDARAASAAAARRLLDIGERFGVDPLRGVALNELWDDMQVKDLCAKLWPQTERLKAWCVLLEHASSDGEAERACRGILGAARGLEKYFRAELGLWHEVCAADGSFIPAPCKASSLYHVVGAIDVLRHTVAARAPADSRIRQPGAGAPVPAVHSW